MSFHLSKLKTASIEMSHLSTSLRSESEKYRKAARNINFYAMLRQYAPLGAVLLLVIILLYWRFS
jgi:vesicle transport protein SEC22